MKKVLHKVLIYFFNKVFAKKIIMLKKRINAIFIAFLQLINETNDQVLIKVGITGFKPTELRLDFNYDNLIFFLQGEIIPGNNYALIKTFQIKNNIETEITDLEIKAYNNSEIVFTTPKMINGTDCTTIPFAHLFALCYITQLVKLLNS